LTYCRLPEVNGAIEICRGFDVILMPADSDEKQHRPRIQSIGRGFSVLFAIARSERGLYAKDIIQELGLDRQIVYHILQSLSAVGVVTKIANNRYVLGLRVADLIEGFPRHLAPSERLAPMVRALSRETGESAYAVGWLNSEIIVVTAVRGSKTVSAAEVPQGYASHAHARASGKLLLALADRAQAEAYLSRHKLGRLTPNTITNRAALDREFEKIRLMRTSIEREEFAPGLCCMAMPIGEFGSSYVLAISVPAERFETHLERYSEAMRRIAEGGDWR
jgi:IclR family acetate operon transcriptional repressor